MWPFKHKTNPEDTKLLRDRLAEFELRIRRVEEDWTEVYNKFRTLQMRVAKQVQRLDANSSTEEPQGAGSDENGDSPKDPLISSLSPRAQKIQREILARRQRAQGGE